MTANAAKLLIEHYVDNFRRLPWRSAPGRPAPDPYWVWLSEIMLQQTSVAAVRPRFERFVQRWPTVAALAAAKDEDVLGEWAGLGYYARARNLIACARQVVARGGFPQTSAELRSFPGIGSYTSAAIAAIAFGEVAPAVDTNVERVISRLHALNGPTRRDIERRVLEIMPRDRPGDFVQALMDLGATVCRPRNPRCGECPLRSACKAFASPCPEAFPERRQRRVRPQRYGTAYWVERGGSLWLVRRPPNGPLGGMPALPGTAWTEHPEQQANPIGMVHHVFTHFSLDLAIVASEEAIGEGWWQPLERLDQTGFPTLYRKCLAVVLGAHDQLAA